MFDDCNTETNGETRFYNHICKSIQSIFDVGCKTDSLYENFEGEVHYFDPVEKSVDEIEKRPNKNSFCKFNRHGLGNMNGELFYYPRHESFCNRITTCNYDDDANKVCLQIRKAKDYIVENGILSIDFLKIDTEGYEFEVIKGFEDKISIVKIIQFEYGGTFIDSGVKLIEIVNYLRQYGFDDFVYLTNATHDGKSEPITDFADHYRYCNIVAYNKNKTV